MGSREGNLAKLLGIGCKLEPLTIHCIEATALTRYPLKPNKMNKDTKSGLKYQEKQDDKPYNHVAPYSVREIERRFSLLLKEVKNDPSYTRKSLNFNLYTCECGWNVITKDVDAGVTPFMIQCEQCGGFAKSNFYHVEEGQRDGHTKEWFRPSLKQVLKLRKRREELEHVLRGGLLLRNIKTKQDEQI